MVKIDKKYEKLLKMIKIEKKRRKLIKYEEKLTKTMKKKRKDWLDCWKAERKSVMIMESMIPTWSVTLWNIAADNDPAKLGVLGAWKPIGA